MFHQYDLCFIGFLWMSFVTDISLFVISMETFNSVYRSTHVEVQAAHFCCSHRQPLSSREAQWSSMKILTKGWMMLLILLQRPSCYKHDCPTSYLYVEDNWGWTWRAFVSFQKGSRGNVYHKLGCGQLPHRHRRLAWHSLQFFSLPLALAKVVIYSNLL